MIYHLTRRDYLVVLDDDSSEDESIHLSELIEKWEVDKILNTGEPEIETLIKSN